MRQRSLCFVVPAQGRLEIANVCLRQLRRTCDALADRNILASAVVIADDENLDIARSLDFATVERDNTQLGRKVNDGYELAGSNGFDYMVPAGNDDWIDPNWIRLPRNGETTATHLCTVVNPGCTRMASLTIRYGDGIRVYSRRTLERVGFRPAEEFRSRAIDTTTHNGVKATGARLVFHDTHPLCIVDFKSPENLNDYAGCVRHYSHRRNETSDVWGTLATVYPADAIREMQAVVDVREEALCL